MEDRDQFPTASELNGHPASGMAPRVAWAHEPAQEAVEGGGGRARDAGFNTTVALDRRPSLDPVAEEASAAPKVQAEWALWGKEATDSAYHVLRCSEGTFGLGDFHGIITRYASGVKEKLPQYTVCWIPPGKGSRSHRAPGEVGDQGYIAVGIHELASADPSRSGGRPRTAGGREIEYIRLFCVRYAGLKALRGRYTDLVEAVRDEQLLADSTDPVWVDLPDTSSRPVPAPLAALAENVATLLLTTRPVCILGAEAATAEDRLLFIDLVMSLLPYGLRATLSASTWASSTAQDLKLRLFFSNAKRDDKGRTSYVTCGHPVELRPSTGDDDDAPWLYLSWLRQLGPHAAAAAVDLTDPVQFRSAEIRQMVASLPKDRSIEDSLRELANNLRQQDPEAVSLVVRRLKSYLNPEPQPAERQECRLLIAQLDLLNSHPWLHANTRASVYRVLLSLAFEAPLSYAGYREIETCAGGPPRGTLRTVMLNPKFRYATFVPWLLAAKAEREFSNEELMGALAEHGLSATTPLQTLQRDAGRIRREHRRVLYDFGVRYLRRYGEDPRAELVRRGYLADTLEVVFPRDRQAQRVRLEDTLRFVYGGPLSRGQIRELFADPELRPTAAFEAAVARLASQPRARRFVAKQAEPSRLRYADDADDAPMPPDDTRPGLRWHAPNTILGFPKPTVYAVGLLLLALAFGLFFVFGARV